MKLYSLRAKFLAAFLILAFLPLGLMECLEYFNDKNVLLSNAYRSLYSASFQVAYSVDTFIQSNLAVIEVEAKLPALAEYLKLSSTGTQTAESQQKIEQILESFTNRNRLFIVSYALLDLAGHDIADTDKNNLKKDFSESTFFRPALASGTAYVSPVDFSQNENSNGFLYFSCEITDSLGEPVGVLRVQYRAEILQQLLAKSSNFVGPDSFAVLFDENDIPIADGHLLKPDYKKNDDQAELRAGLARVDQPEPYFTLDFPRQGNPKMAGAVTRMGAAPWLVVFFQREDVFLGPVYGQLQWKSYFALFMVVLVAVFALILSRRLARPIIRLTKASQQVSAGDLRVQAEITSSDEIGLLSLHFNQMVQILHRSHEDLERKVEERTIDLFAANQELVAMNEEVGAMNDALLDTNHQLEKEVEIRRQAELEILRRERQYRAITSVLTCEAEDLGSLLALILRDALRLIKAPGGYIGLYDASGKSLVIHCVFGQDESESMERLAADKKLQTSIYEKGEMLHIEDYRQYEKETRKEQTERLSTVVMLPLKEKNQVTGILVASWFDEIYPISQDDVAVLRQFGDLASIALQRAAAKEQIRRVAFGDVLTDLPNRASLAQHLEEEMARARRGLVTGVLLFVDLDDLKSVNDTLGHLAGDAVIKQAAAYLLAAVGKGAFVARISGDEFIVMVSSLVGREQAANLAEKIVKALCQEYEVAAQRLHLSASVGVVTYPDDGNQAEDILRRADSAMYAAKQAGRNCWRFYEPALLEEASEKVLLTNALRQALEQKELYLHYQPLVSIDGREIVGFEALLRWHNSVHNNVSPARFIPLAEASGLIIPIGHWVLEQACFFARRLSDMGKKNVHVAVNISARQLAADDFVATVCQSIEAAGIQASQIELEVTESILIESMAASVKKLNELRMIGVSLSLDDFGTGYSSLTYLRHLPVTVLKIDKSFVDQIAFDETQLQIVGSIICLGHNLQMTVVAEGVEVESQLTLLRQFGCDCIQGFIFGRPITEDAAVQLLMSKNFSSHI